MTEAEWDKQEQELRAIRSEAQAIAYTEGPNTPEGLRAQRIVDGIDELFRELDALEPPAVRQRFQELERELFGKGGEAR